MLHATLAILLNMAPMAEPIRCEGCSCRGGPGFRAENGKCVGWKELKRKCGDPPETRCADERDGKRRGTEKQDEEAD